MTDHNLDCDLVSAGSDDVTATKNSAAFNCLLQRITETGRSRTLYVPVGVYYFDDTLEIRRGQSIRGDGPANLRYVGVSGRPAIRIASEDCGRPRAFDGVLEGLTLGSEGERSWHGDESLDNVFIEMARTERYRLEQITIAGPEGANTTALRLLPGCIGIQVQQLFVQNFHRFGIHIAGNGSNNNTFSKVVVRGNIHTPIVIEGSNGNRFVDGILEPLVSQRFIDGIRGHAIFQNMRFERSVRPEVAWVEQSPDALLCFDQMWVGYVQGIDLPAPSEDCGTGLSEISRRYSLPYPYPHYGPYRYRTQRWPRGHYRR